MLLLEEQRPGGSFIHTGIRSAIRIIQGIFMGLYAHHEELTKLLRFVSGTPRFKTHFVNISRPKFQCKMSNILIMPVYSSLNKNKHLPRGP